jgi:hypothetical protein
MWVGAGLAAALLLAPGWASGEDLGACVPVRWPGGPLEVARRAAAKPLPAALASALERWYQPWSLDLLTGTPVNCLLVTWSPGGTTAEQEQRRILRDYTAEAHRRGISIIALLASPEEADRSAKLAANDGLDGTTHLAPSPAISPGVRVFSKNGAVQATPTSEPWIDSNLWLVRLLRTQNKAPVWLDYTLDGPSEAGYLRASADAAAANGHWVVTPDDALLIGLAAGAPQATSCWRRVTAALQFFEDHADWRRFLPTGPLGIVQPDNSSAPENLNLITRRRIPYRLLDRAALSEPGLRNLQAVLTVGIPLTKEEKTALRQFAELGGLAIVGPSWGDPVPNGKSFLEKPCGKGRIVIYREDEPDSESLSKDVLYLMGKDNLGLRLFHAPSVLPQVSASADGRQLLITIVNYATEPAEAIVLRLTGHYRSARFYGLEGPPAALDLEQSERGMQLTLPKVPVYAAVVLEK